jgi:hypothetical protein
MNLSAIRFPRQLEMDGSADMIRRTLMSHTTKLWAGSAVDVPVLTLAKPLQAALLRARLQGRIRCGIDPIFENLAGEKKGITLIRDQSNTPYGERLSRLLLFSNDGAERFYRRIEQALQNHAPRLLGCLLDMDGSALGQMITGKEGIIKIIMIEHKDGVSDILRAHVDNRFETSGSS